MIYDAFISIDPDDPCHYWRIENIFMDDTHTSILREFEKWAPPMDVCWNWGWGLQGLQDETTTFIQQYDNDADDEWWKTLPPRAEQLVW